LNDIWYVRYGPTFSLGRFEKWFNKDIIDYHAFGYSAIWQTSIGMRLNADSEKNPLSAYYFNLELVTAISYNNVFDHTDRSNNELFNAFVGLKLNLLWDIEPMMSFIRQLKK